MRGLLVCFFLVGLALSTETGQEKAEIEVEVHHAPTSPAVDLQAEQRRNMVALSGMQVQLEEKDAQLLQCAQNVEILKAEVVRLSENAKKYDDHSKITFMDSFHSLKHATANVANYWWKLSSDHLGPTAQIGWTWTCERASFIWKWTVDNSLVAWEFSCKYFAVAFAYSSEKLSAAWEWSKTTYFTHVAPKLNPMWSKIGPYVTEGYSACRIFTTKAGAQAWDWCSTKAVQSWSWSSTFFTKIANIVGKMWSDHFPKWITLLKEQRKSIIQGLDAEFPGKGRWVVDGVLFTVAFLFVLYPLLRVALASLGSSQKKSKRGKKKRNRSKSKKNKSPKEAENKKKE